MNIAELEPRADEAAELLAAMSNPKRLLILCNLLAGELSVNELAARVDLAQSPLSQHLSKAHASLVFSGKQRRKFTRTICLRRLGSAYSAVPIATPSLATNL